MDIVGNPGGGGVRDRGTFGWQRKVLIKKLENEISAGTERNEWMVVAFSTFSHFPNIFFLFFFFFLLLLLNVKFMSFVLANFVDGKLCSLFSNQRPAEAKSFEWLVHFADVLDLRLGLLCIPTYFVRRHKLAQGSL